MSLDTAALATMFPPDSTYTTTHGWVSITGVAILGFGKEPMIHNLVEEILRRVEHGEQGQIQAFRKLREGCLKASPLVGFPRVSVDLQASKLLLCVDLESACIDRRCFNQRQLGK